MAPKKRSRTDEKPPSVPSTTRVTRSSTAAASTTTTPKTTAAAPPPPAVRRQKKQKVEEVKKAEEPLKTVVIEHCKQCNQFKMRATKVKDALENDISGINVLVNPEKPRRGCFEVREEGGEIFISLLDMKRPFKPMRELDMDQVISDIIDKLK